MTDKARELIAEAIWSVRRESEDRCDMELEDLGPDHSVWYEADAVIAALVIELPTVRPEPASSGDALKSDGEAATWNIWVGEKLAKAECREAIKASGLKVAP